MCIFAGGAATAHLLKEEHSEAQSSDDRDEIKTLLEKFSENESLRQSVRRQAEGKAHDLVRQEEKAVTTLAAVLLERGKVDGPEAERIIKENLNGA
jgi:hypothetical protein